MTTTKLPGRTKYLLWPATGPRQKFLVSQFILAQYRNTLILTRVYGALLLILNIFSRKCKFVRLHAKSNDNNQNLCFLASTSCNATLDLVGSRIASVL